MTNKKERREGKNGKTRNERKGQRRKETRT